MTLLDELKLIEGPITRAWKQRGVEEGLEQGIKEGAAEGRQQALLTIFNSRGLTLSTRLRTRILGCTDVDTLDR